MAKIDPYSCWDGVVNGAAGDEEFENILSILDFPMESLEADFAGDWDVSKSQNLGPIPSDVLMGPPMISESKIRNGPHVLLHGQALIDATEPKPLPYRFEETSASCIRRHNKSFEVQEQGVFQSQSPVSVLENSGSSLPGKSSLIKSHISKRTRSRRARPSGVNPWLSISPLFATSSTSRAKKIRERRNKSSRASLAKKTIEDSSNVAGNSFRAYDYVEPQNSAPSQQRPLVTKKCTHCEVTKTPQWREGPMGPKTLCNACGVRYRSGRLYPEYRPAASPTFVPSLHSNSHKKVIEMRTTAKHQQVAKIEDPLMSPQPEFIPVSGYFFDPIC